jgi:hypothetical protein
MTVVHPTLDHFQQRWAGRPEIIDAVAGDKHQMMLILGVWLPWPCCIPPSELPA